MPLKHVTETAYLVFLGLVICAAGFLASMLPALPEGLKYWVLCFSVFSVYPIFLMPTFRHNRADYEFRLLHWFPSIIFVLWIVFQIIDPFWVWFHILRLGFFSIWSLPLVALGLGSGIAFSLHVLRRRTIRVTMLSIFLALFTVGAAMGETKGWNDRMQEDFFTKHTIAFLRPLAGKTRSFVASLRYPQSSGSTIALSTSSASSHRSSQPKIALQKKKAKSSVSSSVIAEHTPKRLPKSGPETALVLFATLVALYMGTLHVRGRKRA